MSRLSPTARRRRLETPAAREAAILREVGQHRGGITLGNLLIFTAGQMTDDEADDALEALFGSGLVYLSQARDEPKRLLASWIASED